MRADAGLQPYVVFNAELRRAFQAFLAQLQADCGRLVRHLLDAATSSYAPMALLSLAPQALDTDGGSEDADEDDLQNVPPATVVHQPHPPPTQVLPTRCGARRIIHDSIVHDVLLCYALFMTVLPRCVMTVLLVEDRPCR
jgi:hypothetical protein